MKFGKEMRTAKRDARLMATIDVDSYICLKRSRFHHLQRTIRKMATVVVNSTSGQVRKNAIRSPFKN
jgi:hypothetical protein